MPKYFHFYPVKKTDEECLFFSSKKHFRILSIGEISKNWNPIYSEWKLIYEPTNKNLAKYVHYNPMVADNFD